MSKHRWDHETCQICGLMRSGSRVTGGLTYHTPDGRASLRAGPCSRWVPEVGDSVRRSDTDMSGEVTKVTKTSSLISDGASTHHVRVRWASGSESTVPNAKAGAGMTRKRPLVHLSLSPDALSRLAEIATRCGETRSGVVERLIRDADMPRPRMAELIEAFDGSATLQVEAIMGLFRPNNVEELITEMPAAFRKRFLEWCFALSRGGPPLGELEHAFAQGFDAVRQWMVATAAETAEDVRTTEEADLRLDEGFPFEDNSVPDKSHELPRKACAHRPLHRPP